MTRNASDQGGDDYATVFASIVQSPAALSPFMRTARFRALVDERRRGFVGREDVFEAVDEITRGERFPSGYVVIRGEPGIGKTAIAAGLVMRGAYVHHFNIAPENIRSTRMFLENVCAQLILRYDLDHDTLPPHAGTDGGFLMELLHEAVDRARERDELPVVVVVDALDEAEETDSNRLCLPRTLPAGVFFVVTAREEDDIKLDVDNVEDIPIREQDPGNQRAVTHYIEGYIAEHAPAMHARIAEWDLTDDEFVSEVAAISEGNFMYLVHVLPEIERGRLARDAVGSIKGLPRGLNGYYSRHWTDMKDADQARFEQQQRPVLCFLAIVREPVTTTQLSEWTDLEPGPVLDVIREWLEFLNEDDESVPSLFRIYHRSFAEFLDQRENLRWYHDQIAERALAKIPGFLDS